MDRIAPQINEDRITKAVLDSFSATPDPRFKRVITALVEHLHAFVREVELSDPEWMQAVAFLTRTGQTCTSTRQEFILLSDALGVTTLVDAINHRHPSGATSNSVLGPFFSENRPAIALGADISGGAAGTPLFFQGWVVDAQGAPVAGAEVDVWHSDGEGHYDAMLADLPPGRTAMRGLMRTDSSGRFWFRSVTPSPYPVPGDGPVGEMMTATLRSNMRPAHLHVLINAQGFERLTTMVFALGDKFLDNDPVFGVKEDLVQVFDYQPTGVMPDGSTSHAPFCTVSHTFHIARKDVSLRA